NSRHVWCIGKPDREHAETVFSLHERQQQGARLAETQAEIRHLQREVGHEHRLATRERLRQQRRFAGARRPWLDAKFVEAIAGGRVKRAAAWVVFEEQRAVAASCVEGLPVQM